MAVKDLLARGIGFSPGGVNFIVTHGYAINTSVERQVTSTEILQIPVDYQIARTGGIVIDPNLQVVDRD